MERTIPGLLTQTVESAPQGRWLFHGDAVFTYEQAWGRIGTAAAGLADLGIGQADLVLVPMRNIAEEAGIPTPHLAMLRSVAEAHAAATGKRLPINGAGVAGAAFADLGFRPEIVRGFALLARTAGLVAHLAEEMAHPIGRQLWLECRAPGHRRGRALTGPIPAFICNSCRDK